MSDSTLGTAKARIEVEERLSPVYEDDIEDWDVPPIDPEWPRKSILVQYVVDGARTT